MTVFIALRGYCKINKKQEWVNLFEVGCYSNFQRISDPAHPTVEFTYYVVSIGLETRKNCPTTFDQTFSCTYSNRESV